MSYLDIYEKRLTDEKYNKILDEKFAGDGVKQIKEQHIRTSGANGSSIWAANKALKKPKSNIIKPINRSLPIIVLDFCLILANKFSFTNILIGILLAVVLNMIFIKLDDKIPYIFHRFIQIVYVALGIKIITMFSIPIFWNKIKVLIIIVDVLIKLGIFFIFLRIGTHHYYIAFHLFNFYDVYNPLIGIADTNLTDILELLIRKTDYKNNEKLYSALETAAEKLQNPKRLETNKYFPHNKLYKKLFDIFCSKPTDILDSIFGDHWLLDFICLPIYVIFSDIFLIYIGGIINYIFCLDVEMRANLNPLIKASIPESELDIDIYDYFDTLYAFVEMYGLDGTMPEFSYFKNCTTLKEVKKLYRQLAKELHPDNNNGDSSSFDSMNKEYDIYKKRFA